MIKTLVIANYDSGNEWSICCDDYVIDTENLLNAICAEEGLFYMEFVEIMKLLVHGFSINKDNIPTKILETFDIIIVVENGYTEVIKYKKEP